MLCLVHLTKLHPFMVAVYIIFEIIFTVRVGCKGRYDVGYASKGLQVSCKTDIVIPHHVEATF